MIPRDDFTPHGYLDNPYHSWKLNPSGVLRSLAPLGMGWHVPNYGSYVRNQFQYTAHLNIGIKLGEQVLMTPEDFQQQQCVVSSPIHTKNRFAYTCSFPAYALMLEVRYFLVQEHVLGCVLSLQSTAAQPMPVTLYITHVHTHNPHTSRLWEHGFYARQGAQEGTLMLGLASEGDVFMHGARSADGGALVFGDMVYTVSLAEAANWARGNFVEPPTVTQRQEENGWQVRTLVLPCQLEIGSGQQRIINVVLARGVSQDEASLRWFDSIEEIAHAEAEHRADDEQFWSQAPQLSGDWPESWRRGWVYDLETLRMIVRSPIGVIGHTFDAMQIQAPRLVLAEAAMDALFLSYVNPELAAEMILGHFESAPHPNVPCIREDGSYNMVADDGQVCGTAPSWGYPIWCCHQIFLKTGNMHWLRRLYPRASAYIHWWLEHRHDTDGWITYACSWESGQDVSSRFGPQQTGGTLIQHVCPVDLQASIAQSATILSLWAKLLAEEDTSDMELKIHFGTEVGFWQAIAEEFTAKTRSLWQDDWFRDFDAAAGEWSTEQDTMHFAPVFCGAASNEQIAQLHPSFARPPMHSGWAPLSWPPVVMTIVGAAAAAGMHAQAAELAYQYIDAAYRSADSRTLDEDGGVPGVTREYLRSQKHDGQEGFTYQGAGIEGYGWGAVSIHLLLRYIMGLYEVESGIIKVKPMLPVALRKAGASYRVGSVQWGKHTLDVECTLDADQNYTMRMQSVVIQHSDPEATVLEPTVPEQERVLAEEQWEWNGTWGEERILQLP